MYYVYIIESDLSDKYYIGYTNDYIKRWRGHKFKVKSGSTVKLYSWIRKYGIENVEVVLIDSFDNKEDAYELEVSLIRSTPPELSLNLHPGGSGGYAIEESRKSEWLSKLKVSRAGAKPALGMKHSDENKKKFSEYGKYRWDIYGRYPVQEILSLSFIEANKSYGISKTHYYRLRKQYD